MIQLTDRERCLIALGATEALPRLKNAYIDLLLEKFDPEIAGNTFLDAVHNMLEEALVEYLANEENMKDWELRPVETEEWRATN